MQITELKINEITAEQTSEVLKTKGWDAYNRLKKQQNLFTRVYVWTEGETIIENLQNRRQRPHTIYKKELIPVVLWRMGLPADTKVRWSQKAGCGCGCSPGFIIDGDWGGKSVHLKVS